jgi:hypothetical protein
VAERPIISSAPMVRAILAGRKTQTRRLLTVPWQGSKRSLPYEPYWVEEDGRLLFCDEYGEYHDVERTMRCPYGKPGDRLWVKETFAALDLGVKGKACIAYRATCPGDAFDFVRGPSEVERIKVHRWKSPLFMARDFSRLLLEVTEVRVQRLQEISDEDAAAEGVCLETSEDPRYLDAYAHGPRAAFSWLWDHLNADRAPWASNPWVWAVTFCQVEVPRG